MEHSNQFIGIGKNPDGPDLPLGLGMELAQNPKAMNAFGTMTKSQKASMISHIQAATTGEDAKQRIREAVNQLSNNQTQL
ncbi:MAG: YdeI/OmpD-associated family protein [Oscillospiraceae bacterium]